jgi:hypothetical protein
MSRAMKPRGLGPKSLANVSVGTVLIRWSPPSDGFGEGGYIPEQLTFVKKNTIGMGRVVGGRIYTSMVFHWDKKHKLWKWNLWRHDNNEESYKIGRVPKSVTQYQMERWNSGFGHPF